MNVKRISFDEIEDLKREWTSKWVEVDASRPELKRFSGRPGRVITVNMSGRALVQFDEADGFGWGRFDISLPFLKQVAAPAPAAKPKEEKHAAPEKPKAAATDEAKPAAKNSPIEMMRAKAAQKAAAGGEVAKPGPAPSATEQRPAGKMSPIEIMRAKAAAKAAGGGQTEPSATTPAEAGTTQAEKPADSTESKPAGKMSPLEMIRAKAAAKKAADESKPTE